MSLFTRIACNINCMVLFKMRDVSVLAVTLMALGVVNISIQMSSMTTNKLFYFYPNMNPEGVGVGGGGCPWCSVGT